MVVSRLAEETMSMPLLYRGGQLFGTRDSMPLSDQFAISSEHENAEIRCSLRLAKLRRHRSIKIGRNENVFPDHVQSAFLRIGPEAGLLLRSPGAGSVQSRSFAQPRYVFSQNE